MPALKNFGFARLVAQCTRGGNKVCAVAASLCERNRQWVCNFMRVLKFFTRRGQCGYLLIRCVSVFLFSSAEFSAFGEIIMQIGVRGFASVSRGLRCRRVVGVHSCALSGSEVIVWFCKRAWSWAIFFTKLKGLNMYFWTGERGSLEG